MSITNVGWDKDCNADVRWYDLGNFTAYNLQNCSLNEVMLATTHYLV